MKAFFASVALVLSLGLTVAAQDVVMTDAAVAEVYNPVAVEHQRQERVIVTSLLDMQQLTESQYRRFDTVTVFTAPVGQYLVQSGGRFGVVEVRASVRDERPAHEIDDPLQAPPPAAKPPSDDTVSAEKGEVEVWVFMGTDCRYCDDWKENELPKLRNQPGVSVYFVEPDQHKEATVPTFVIRSHGKTIKRGGYSNGWNDAAHILAFEQESKNLAIK